MNPAHLLAATAAGTALTSPAACSEDDDGVNGGVDAFCAPGNEIKETTSRINRFESAADADEFARQANAAIDDGDLAAFEDGAVDEITARMDAFCERG